jgi:hypothetical protein
MALASVFAVLLLGPLAAEAQALKWKNATGGQVKSSPTLGPDGTVYVGSYDNSIYAINSGVGCNCPAGTFVSSPALLTSCAALASVCTPCPLGSFCPYLRSAAMFPSRCPTGCFCNATGMAAPLLCPASHYCPSSDVGPSFCTGGSYSPFMVASFNATCSQLCVMGTFCPPGSSAMSPCPAGSFCPSDGMSAPLRKT